MKKWYVIYTQAMAESKAAFHLRRQGYDTYLPVYSKRRRHARKTTKVLAPLFPRYLFVCLDIASQSWRAIRSTVGVSHIVCNGEMPSPVPEILINEIRTREGDDGVVMMNYPGALAPGDSVRIEEGPLQNQKGLFSGISADQRVVVLLSLLGREMEVCLPFEAVSPTA